MKKHVIKKKEAPISSIIIKNAECLQTKQFYIAKFNIVNDKEIFKVEIKSKTKLNVDYLDFALPVVLFSAMKMGKDIIVEGKVSNKFLSNIPLIQDIFNFWYKEYKKIQVSAKEKVKTAYPNNSKVGCFFTAGVDSTYTLLKHFDEISELIYVDGFYDKRIGNEEITQSHLNHLKQISKKINKPLIEIKTNLRDYIDRYGIWGDHNHGAGLASVALLLSNRFKKIYVAASHTYSALLKWGSHPLLDPLWTNESLEYVNDGCEATRPQKVRNISENNILLNSLRVCFGVFPNCGKCEKCIRTWINLLSVDAVNKCEGIFVTKERFTPYHISRLKVAKNDEGTKALIMENISSLKEKNKNPEIVKALYHCLNRTYYKRYIGIIRRIFSYIFERLLRIIKNKI